MSVSIQFLSGEVFTVKTMPTLAEFRQEVSRELKRTEEAIQLFDFDHVPLSRVPLQGDLCYIYLHDSDSRLIFDSEKREFHLFVKEKLVASYIETASEFFASDTIDYYWVVGRFARDDSRLLDFEITADVVTIMKRDTMVETDDIAILAEEFVRDILNISAKVNVIQK